MFIQKCNGKSADGWNASRINLRRQNSNAKISGIGRKRIKVGTRLEVVTVVNIR